MLTLAPCSTLGTHIYFIGIMGINQNTVNIPCFTQPFEIPRFTAINTFIHTKTSRLTVPRIAFASTHPDHVWIGGINCYIPNGSDFLIIKNGFPFDAATFGFPKAARGGTDINDIRIGKDNINGCYTAAHTGGTNTPGFHSFKFFHIQSIGRKDGRYQY